MSEILEEYMKELVDDTHLDQMNLTEQQMRLPTIKHKWVSRLIQHKDEVRKLKTLLNQARKKVVAQLKTSDEAVGLSKVAMDKLADQHETIQKIKDEIWANELIVEYLGKMESIFRGMSFDIKNLVELMKMETM